jgi:hypothetical protein
LDQFKASGAQNPDPTQTQDLQARIAAIQEQLGELAQERNEASNNALAYQLSLQADKAGSKLSIEQQIQDINVTISDLQNQEAAIRGAAVTDIAGQAAAVQNLEAQILSQRNLRDQLQSQRRSINDSTQAAAAAGQQENLQETEEMRMQRLELEQELHDLQASEPRPPATPRPLDIQELQNQIANQQTLVQDLKRQYAERSSNP